jgi:hydroxymethylglutaryl-CoA reductase
MSTSINGMRTFDEKIFMKPDKSYQVWVAVEARKKEIYKRMKLNAKAKSSLSEAEKKAIDVMIDKAIEDTGDSDN